MNILRAILYRWFVRDKSQWELDFQRSWAKLFAQPGVSEKVHEYWKQYRHLDEILSRVAITAATDVLDVGCGISTVLHYLTGRRVGVDPLADRYAEVYAYPPEMRIIQAAAESLPFEDASFDVIFCSNCIDHMSDPPQAVAEMHRVLRRRGHLVLTCEVFPKDRGFRGAGEPHTMTAESLLALARPFSLVQQWDSPWFGLKRYVEGKGPKRGRREQILLLAKD